MNPMKAIAKAILPDRLRRFVKSVVSPSYRDRLEWEEDRRRGQVVVAATGGAVVAGPFSGLRYVSTARGSSIGPKLLGTYEMELRPAVDAIVARAYPVIINIGAGEGYYSVGLAKRMSKSRIISFDA